MIVLSHGGFNENPGWKSIIIVPFSTSASQAMRGPIVVEIPAGVIGLPKPSVAVCHKITTLDRAKLTRRVGVLPAELLVEVCEAVKAAIDLD